ncbi:hypothetical protein RHSIM_Rhsim01G0124900 [Rhododendron simsii]|uniref:Uncharacterized protein n=1 Tax=Rhododendron simsii TaxID=118357 RepID=A0A834M0I7_RHOSS|nr:hypothetical protein RHSIM_Rhsim01G0124900 [Rhododendron simsii]
MRVRSMHIDGLYTDKDAIDCQQTVLCFEYCPHIGWNWRPDIVTGCDYKAFQVRNEYSGEDRNPKVSTAPPGAKTLNKGDQRDPNTQAIFHSRKLSSKLEDHRHRESEALSASLHSFRSNISNSLNQLSPNSKPPSELLSLTWIQQCLELLSTLNKAFAKLAVEIEYPINKWESPSVEKYLNYSLKLLEFLNSISSSLSHLGQARVSISHALSLVESSPQSAIERLVAIQFKNLQSNDLKVEEKEEIVLFGLSGDIEPYLAIKKAASGFPVSSLVALDLSFSEAVAEEKAVPKQLREVKEAAACLVAAVGDGESGSAAKQLERKLEVMEELLDTIGKEADGIFSEVLAGRNELLDVLRQLKQ